jgi:hypothetical protein
LLSASCTTCSSRQIHYSTLPSDADTTVEKIDGKLRGNVLSVERTQNHGAVAAAQLDMDAGGLGQSRKFHPFASPFRRHRLVLNQQSPIDPGPNVCSHDSSGLSSGYLPIPLPFQTLEPMCMQSDGWAPAISRPSRYIPLSKSSCSEPTPCPRRNAACSCSCIALLLPAATVALDLVYLWAAGSADLVPLRCSCLELHCNVFTYPTSSYHIPSRVLFLLHLLSRDVLPLPVALILRSTTLLRPPFTEPRRSLTYSPRPSLSTTRRRQRCHRPGPTPNSRHSIRHIRGIIAESNPCRA